MTPLALRVETASAPARAGPRLRRAPLAVKLAIAFLGLVAFVLLVNGAVDTYLTYNQAKRAALEVESEKARGATERVAAFLADIQTQLGWTTGAEWGYAKLEQQRYDFIRLLRQAPAITALAFIDGKGREQIAVSRLEPDAIASAKDFSADPRFVRAVAEKIWFGPVEFRRGSEPYMTIALAHVGKNPGVTVADVNLKLVWDVVSAIHVGDKGFAYVVDDHGRLIAHPDLSLVLRDSDFSALPQVAEAMKGQDAGAAVATSLDGGAVLTAFAIEPKTHWAVFVEQPLSEALAAAYATLARAAGLLGLGLLLAAVTGVALARRMAAPIRQLQAGAEKLGAGDLTQRLDIRTGDEIEALAGGFNRMAGQLQESYENLEGKVETRTKDLNEALAQQTATADVLKVISRSPSDLKPVLDAIADTAARLCGSDMTMFFRYDGQAFRILASWNFPDDVRAMLEAKAPAPGHASALGRAGATLKAAYIADVLAEPGYELKTEQNRARYRATLAVPMLREGKLVGALSLNRAEPDSFTSKHIELVSTFADQAAIAFENVRLFEEVRARTNDLEEALAQQTATADALKVISRSALGLREVMQTLVDSAVRLCADDGVVYLRKGDAFLAEAAFDADEDKVRARNRTPRTPGRGSVTGRVALSGEVEFIPDTLADAEFDLAPDLRLKGIRSLVGVPLLRDGQVDGVFILGRREPGRFGSRAVELAKTFADQAVIVIENVRLFDEVQARTHEIEEALAQQTATADVLKTISRSAFDPQAVLEALIDSAMALSGSVNGVIWRFEDGAMRSRAFAGGALSEFVAYMETHPQPPGRGSTAARIALTGQVQNNPDLFEDPETPDDLKSIVQTRASLGVPMKRGEELLGAIVVAKFAPGRYSERIVDLVKTFADQAVIAIENARLFAEVQAKTRDLEQSLAQQTATAEVLKVISRSAFDLDTVFQTLVTSAVDLCKASSGTLCVLDGEAFRYRGMAGPEATMELQGYLEAHPLTHPTRQTAAGRAILSRQTEQIEDVLTEPDYAVPMAAHGSPARSLLSVPLLGNTVVLGAIVVARAEPGGFPLRHVEILRTFADQAVIAIENSRLFDEVQARTRDLEQSLADLRKTQDRLVQSEKLASLGQLTAGIAHEIKNPLNFVNNFATLSRELLEELREALQRLPDDARADADDLMGMIDSNLEKVASHGKRADSIVKNMLLHSREGSGERTRVNVNAMLEEALNLGYHGARAEKPGFNVGIEKSLDPNAGEAELYLQEVTRVLLNLISNGFYATDKRRQAEGSAYQPTLTASTRDLGHSVEIRIRDNGTGIADEVRAKMFNPFFTTKPAGEGTGLGLSLSHDIVVKQHGGTLDFETAPGAFTEFIVTLPREGARA